MIQKRNSIIKYFGLAALVTGLFTSCGDETNFSPYKEEVDSNAAFVKLINTTIGPSGTNFNVIWYLDDDKISSGATPTNNFLTGTGTGSTFPASTNYAQIPSGTGSLRVEIPITAAGQAPTTVATSNLATEAQKNYTSFVAGASPNYVTYTLKDDLSVVAADPSKAYIRFVNVIPNSPAAGYDLSIKELNSNAVIFSGVKYLSATETFIAIPTPDDLEAASFEFQMREVGTTNVVAKVTWSPRKGRVYTLFNRGYVGGLSAGNPSTTVNIPVLTYFTNK